MIKLITLSELSKFQKNFYYKKHPHVEENVFLYIPGQDIKTTRAYNLCKLCGQMVPIVIDDKISKEIKTIVDKKIASQS
jgi:hypothetical protein